MSDREKASNFEEKYRIFDSWQICVVVCCFRHGRHKEKGEEEADAGGRRIKVLENYGFIPGGEGWAGGGLARSEFSCWILVPHSAPGQHSKVNTPVNVLFISLSGRRQLCEDLSVFAYRECSLSSANEWNYSRHQDVISANIGILKLSISKWWSWMFISRRKCAHQSPLERDGIPNIGGFSCISTPHLILSTFFVTVLWTYYRGYLLLFEQQKQQTRVNRQTVTTTTTVWQGSAKSVLQLTSTASDSSRIQMLKKQDAYRTLVRKLGNQVCKRDLTQYKTVIHYLDCKDDFMSKSSVMVAV